MQFFHVALLLALAAQPAKTPAFTDITRQSGLAEIVEEKYAADPKWWLSGLDLVDLDGDGHLDVFMSAHGGTALAALNDGKGHFRAAPGNYPGSEIHLCYDLDEDGRVDLTMTHQDGGGRWWLNRSTPGHLDFKATDLSAFDGQARQNAMIDLDRDGKADWLHEGKPGTITWDKGDGKGALRPMKKTLISSDWKDGPGIIPVDLNGDGYIDLIVSKRGYDEDKTGRCRIFLNDGKGGFTDATAACGLDEAGLQIMGVGDFNRDGALDLICLENGKTVTVYLNDGKAHFSKVPAAVAGLEKASRPGEANWGMAVAVDLDNDGIPDVIMNGRSFLYVLKGEGDGHFTCMNRAWGIDDYSDAAVDGGLCFGDIDGDGMIDLVGFQRVGDRDLRRVKGYHNDLPKQNYINVRPIGHSGNKAAAGAKIRVYEAAPLGDSTKLLGYEQVAVWGRQVCHSYYSYAQTERHFGLGNRQSVDVFVEFYPSGKVCWQRGAAANTTLTIREDAEPVAEKAAGEK
jgi:hypothetical protein